MNLLTRSPDAYRDAPDDDVDPQVVFDALEDEDCRAILSTVRRSPKSVGELEDALDLPSSTAYRKVNKLVDGGLLVDRVRIRQNGHHERAYAPGFDTAVVSLGDGLRVQLTVEDRSDATEAAAEGVELA